MYRKIQKARARILTHTYEHLLISSITHSFMFLRQQVMNFKQTWFLNRFHKQYWRSLYRVSAESRCKRNVIPNLCFHCYYSYAFLCGANLR